MFKNAAILCALVILGGCFEDTSRTTKSFEEEVAEIVSKPVENVNSNQVIPVKVAEPAGALKLKDALRLTLMNNSELKAFSYEVRAAEARQLQAGLWANPELSYEMEDFGGTGLFSGTDSAETTIQLSQLIQLGDKVTRSRNVAGYGSRLAELDYQAKKLDVFSELSQSFIELLFVQKKKQLTEELMKLSEEVIEAVDKRVKAGKDAPLDLSKAKIGLANSKIGFLEVTKLTGYTRKKLASFWDNTKPSFSNAVGNLEEISEIESIEKLESLLDNNPDIARWAIEVQKRNAEKKLADSKAVPDLTVSGGWKRINITNDDAFVIGFSIPLPVFDSNQGGRIEAMENIRKAERQKKAAYLSVRNELNQIHSELDSIYAKIRIYRDQVLPVAEEIFQASRTSYTQGKIDYLTLLDSQRIYFRSKNDYIDTLAQYHILRIQLQRLIGRDITAE